jgi:MFS family permease
LLTLATAVARFAEPLAYTSVFPYLPEMIRDFGIEQNEVAKYAGITSAVFSLAQSLTAVPWGKASDRYGRKPTLLIGLICTMVTFVVWGMSTTLTMAITVRAIQGAGNGNVGIIRTMVAEMVPQKELQPRAFSLMPLVWSLGSVVGPSFGGFLAQPAKKFPAVFGNIEYFKRFPYALPNLVA